MSQKDQYPMCEKLAAHRDEQIAIENFLTWCDEKGYELCDWNNSHFQGECPGHINQSRTSTIMEYLEIDEKVLEEERQAIMKTL